MKSNKFLRLPKVLEQLGVGKTKLWDMVRKEEFPKPIKLGAKIAVWLSSDVESFIEEKIRIQRGTL